MGDEPFDDFLPVSAKRTAPGEYDIFDRDGHRLWFMEGAALAEWVCSVLNSRAVLKAAEEWREAEKAAEGANFAWTEGPTPEADRMLEATFREKSEKLLALREAVDSLRRARDGKGDEG